jgi:hypothetical protein
MINLSLSDLMEYTEWERQKRHEWMRQQGEQVLKVSVGPNDRHDFRPERQYRSAVSIWPREPQQS